MAAENYDAQRADHGKAQTVCTATCRQIVQDDLRPRPCKSMDQDLRLPGSQVPGADLIGNRLIVNSEHRGEILDPVGRVVVIGTSMDLADHSLWYDKGLRQRGQEVEAVGP